METEDIIQKTINTRVQFKSDTAAGWADTSVEGKGGNLILLKGEIGIYTDSNNTKFKVGDGKTAFKDLPFVAGGLETIKAGTGTNAEAFNGRPADAAGGSYSHVEGEWTSAEGYAAHAEGVATKARQHSSHAQGNHTEVPYGAPQGSFAGGSYNDPAAYSGNSESGETGAIFTIGDGDDEENRHNAFIVRKGGYVEAGTTKVGDSMASLVTKQYIVSMEDRLLKEIDSVESKTITNEQNIANLGQDLVAAIEKCTTDEELINTLKDYVKNDELTKTLSEYVKLGSGQEVVQRIQYSPGATVNMRSNSLSVYQCYNSSGNLADMQLTYFEHGSYHDCDDKTQFIAAFVGEDYSAT